MTLELEVSTPDMFIEPVGPMLNIDEPFTAKLTKFPMPVGALIPSMVPAVAHVVTALVPEGWSNR